ncbi:MAG: hypothetical protein JW772_00555 [Candidatus Diapherotrites archaeon]|nr:hypothetical protein [Candidatus Diapherotrites archaeon]
MRRAQSTLEYLLTYGWVLVLIITIAAIAFFVLNAPPEDNFLCHSTDESKIAVETYSIPYSKTYVGFMCARQTCELWGMNVVGDPPGKMVLRNTSNEELRIVRVERLFERQEEGAECYYVKGFVPSFLNNRSFDSIASSDPLIVEAGKNINIDTLWLGIFAKDIEGKNCRVGDYNFSSTHAFGLVYADALGQENTVEIVCENYPIKKRAVQ